MKLHAWSAQRLATSQLPGLSVVIQFADDEGLFPAIYDQENVAAYVKLLRADDDSGSFTQQDATDILDTLARVNVEHIVSQCMAGIGRSVACCMALAKIIPNVEPFAWKPTYNRGIYRTMLAAAGLPQPKEPLVSIAVRVKYGPERLLAFLLSMKAQRYDNWEVICFTDGLRPDIRALVETMAHDKNPVVLMENSQHKGRWGHYYRQAAFEQCRGDWIGTNNDDNYLTPGYIEQLIHVGEETQSDVVTCRMLHRYSAWNVVPAGTDLCAWLARGELVHRVRWSGAGFTADRDYLESLFAASGKPHAEVGTPLVVKN